MHIAESLLPFDKLGFGRFQRQNVGRGLLQALLDGVAARTEIVHFVDRAEFKNLLGKFLLVAALLLDLGVDIGHGLVATHAVFIVRKGLNRLGIGVCEIRRQFRRGRADAYRDYARIALQFELGIDQHFHYLFVGSRGRGIIRAIRLNNHGQNLLRPPIRQARIEDFRVVVA